VDSTATQDPPATANDQEGAKRPAEAPPAKRERTPKPRQTTTARLPVRVTFLALGEFLDELAARPDEIEEATVRACVRYDPPGANVGAQSVTCIAGAIVGGQVLEVVELIGMDWHTGSEADWETHAKREAWLREVDGECANNLWELRGGRFGAL
jgi:hypothetical protein